MNRSGGRQADLIVQTKASDRLTSDAASRAADALIEVRLAAVTDAVRDIKLYEFRRPDDAKLPPAEPGAHIDLHLPNAMVRQYSLCVSEPEARRYVVGIKRDANSRGGSAYIHDHLHVDTQIRIARPRNNFPLAEDTAPSILIAGGIGITPIRCMVQRLADRGRPWRLIYACRSREDAAFHAELEALGHTRFHFDDENSGVPLDLVSALAGAPGDAHLYCCGPAPMLRAFEAVTAGHERERVHVEYFTAKHEPALAGGFAVALARSGVEFVIPPGQSILSVLLDAGIYVDHSCELGICGLCQTTVLEGIPEHRDAFLTEEQQAANNTAMICCAGCKTDRLVLDL